MYKRVFTFGCSFTSYAWPTWADILVEDFQNKGLFGKNFGRCGAGNFYLFLKFMEAHTHYQFNHEDLILICWTSFQREDRRSNGKWHTPGNIFTSNVYTEDFKVSWADPTHYAMRDCAIISNLNSFSKLLGSKIVTFSMSDLKQIDSSNKDLEFDSVNRVIEFYGDTIKTDLPPMMNYLGLTIRNDVTSKTRPKTYWEKDKKDKWIYEWHPTVKEHSRYLNENILPTIQINLEEKTQEFITLWSNKLESINDPICLVDTNWGLYKNNDIIKNV